jgi:hypothetical protein
MVLLDDQKVNSNSLKIYATIGSMNQPENELKRALRAATRSLEEANVAVLMEDAHKHISAAIHQLTFVLERLVEERSDPTPIHY